MLAQIPFLPQEIQTNIASLCSLTSIGVLCLVNKEWYEKASPLLWRHLDFVEAFEDDGRIDATRRFFAHCDTMMDTDPERFAILAPLVRTLDVGRLLGVNIIHGADADYFDYFDPHDDPDQRCVFDVIAQFTNLESLSVYIKSWWEYGSDYAITGSTLASALSRLKSLKVGGQMPPLVLTGLVTASQGLRDLALFNLISSPGQDHGPDPITFLSEQIVKSFTSLETLHLCKLADLDGDDVRQGDDDDESDISENEYVSGMRWPFPREGEINVLEEWASLLQHTSTTLKALTLENRYLCSYGWHNEKYQFIEPGKTHPAGYGANSIRESQRILFPMLSSHEWPRLKQLTLVGMGTPEAVNQVVAHLTDRVHIEQRSARFQIMTGDATPEDISTPIEFNE